jgi:class 3 adenylate cyclase/tetratricopeptide (TPR) repeat protein
VRCSGCGTENEAGRRFCDECGTALTEACPACGATNRPLARFCGSCGTTLAGAPPASTGTGSTPAAGPVAERRLVSVLFADLVGFTPFAEGRDAEDVRDILSRYFDLASQVIGRYGGTVEKFIGDAVMAVWGTPIAHEDDAERAVRAALELVDAVQALAPGVEARGGVLTGEAAVTVGATNQGMVAGDLVNTAARLQSVAPPGSVLVGEATHRSASAAIVFEPAGAPVLKGKTAPVPAWRAIRVVAGARGRNRSETLEAPFVGRDAELRLLKDLFHATEREQRARLVSVIGPAGIGKTRLAWEFLKYVDGLVDTVWWHQGRSPAYGDGISFWALGEMVRGRCGLLETDDETTTRAKLAGTLATHVPDEADRRWIEPALLSLLGFDTGIGSDQLFGAWRTFFERMAATAPVALVFEDFHFADPGLLDFVEQLMEWSRNVPIYVLTLSRPELLERRPTWGAGGRSFASVHLEPLPDAAMRELLAGLVPGLPEPAVRTIVARADGVPLYAVETVRMLLADGRLELHDGAYLPVGELGSLAVPETLTALIASRLDALEAEDRTVVSDAAVLGQSFTPAALAAVSGVPEADLEPRLRALVRRELLALDADPRSPERGQYAFVQALIREVAYNTLSKHDRRARHLAAARFFEALGTDELAGALAGHYLAAHATAPAGPEADALAVQARLALEGAAARATALGSHEQAVTFLEQALTVATNPADRGELLERAGRAAWSGGHVAAAQGFLADAIALHRDRSDRAGAARATAILGKTLISSRKLDDGLALVEPAAAEFADLFPDPGVIALEGQLARGLYLRGEWQRSLEVVERVLEAAERAKLMEVLADALVTKGSALATLGRGIEGDGVIEIGERIAAANGLTTTQLRAINNRVASLQLEDPRAGNALIRVGLELARRIGHRPIMVSFHFNLGIDELLLDANVDAARDTLEHLLAEDPDAGERLPILNSLGWIDASQGRDLSGRLAEIERAETEVTDPRVRGSTLPGLIAFLDGRYAEAVTAFRAVPPGDDSSIVSSWTARAALFGGDIASASAELAALDDDGGFVQPRVIDLRRTGIRAGIAAATGDVDAALAMFGEVLRAWAGLAVAWDEALTALDMAVLLDPSSPAVRAAAERAHVLFTRMGAVRFLAILDAATSRPADRRSAPARGAEAHVAAEPA